MANWYDLGQGGSQVMNFQEPMNFNYSNISPTGAGASYSGSRAPMNAATPEWISAREYDVNQGFTPTGMTGGGAAPSAPGGFMNPTMGSGRGAPTYGRGGGGVQYNMDYTNMVPISSPYMDRIRQISMNPAMLENDPEFKFRQQQGEQALGRSAGARRMRFSGKSMLDFLNYGQGAAHQYSTGIQNNLRANMGAEMPFLQQQAEARNAQNVANNYWRAAGDGRILDNFNSADAYAQAFGGSGRDSGPTRQAAYDRYVRAANDYKTRYGQDWRGSF